MKLAHRKELEELRKTATKSESELAKERLKELEDEFKLDEKEVKLYLNETWTEEVIERMTWLEKLSWVITGTLSDLADVEMQGRINALKDTFGEKEIKGLRQKKIDIEKRKFKKEEESIKAQEASGILPPGSLENLKEMQEKASEYGFKESSLQPDTKFEKLTGKELTQKGEYLAYRAKLRSEELEELQNVTTARQKENAEEVLSRIKPSEYPT